MLQCLLTATGSGANFPSMCYNSFKLRLYFDNIDAYHDWCKVSLNPELWCVPWMILFRASAKEGKVIGSTVQDDRNLRGVQ
jgi:hypothetical protein